MGIKNQKRLSRARRDAVVKVTQNAPMANNAASSTSADKNQKKT
jgi:hypothetical protein